MHSLGTSTCVLGRGTEREKLYNGEIKVVNHLSMYDGMHKESRSIDDESCITYKLLCFYSFKIQLLHYIQLIALRLSYI